MNAALLSALIADACRWCGGGSGWWMGGMVIWMVIFWAALISGSVWVVRAILDRRPQREPDPTEILDLRFAEGEITLDAYQQQKSALLRELTNPRDGAPTHPRARGRDA